MANDKDFILKNAVEVGGSTKVNIGTTTTSSEGYSLTSASYDNVSLDISGQVILIYGTTQRPDGTIFYFVDASNDDVYQYNLSTGWDLSTASYASKSFSVTAQQSGPFGVAISSDGTKMYVGGTSPDAIFQYSLSTAWDVSTASYDSVTFDLSSQSTNPRDMVFKSDGTKMYVCSTSPDAVFQYSLSTAWDLSTVSYDSVSLSTGSNPDGLSISQDGKYMLIPFTSDIVEQYELTTAWDLSTAVLDSTFNFSSFDTGVNCAFYNDDGSKLYMAGYSTDTVYQFSSVQTTNTLDLSAGNYFNETLSANTTYAFSNVGDVQSFQLEVTGASTYTITWPSSIEWSGGVAPDAPASGETDLFTITTDDGGTSYFGVKTADNLS
jgi:sugar lactone lactonase YvrE